MTYYAQIFLLFRLSATINFLENNISTIYMLNIRKLLILLYK